MNPETAALLRQPFKPEEIGHLPKITCRKCSDNKMAKVCDDHKKSSCTTCGNWITSAHMHIEYVGHAEVTDRLLQADPEWEWEAMSNDAQGLPQLDGNGGLWMLLTVSGVTRPGYGHADGKKGGDAVKETIGDALRNAAMRFGVGIDLWGAKFDPPSASIEPDAGIEGAITGDQREVLADLWGLLGFGGDSQREVRLSIAAKLLNLPGLSLFSALTYAQAESLIGLVRARVEEQTATEKKGDPA